ncbi:MAG: L-lactate dehydrogenase complex protein LldG [Nocardioidaceae bacterium]|nr:L-lactate dehydrogenase complex protein LldG [Nocardioidaceae bacterium]
MVGADPGHTVSTRDVVLARIASAREGATVPEVPREYARVGRLAAGSAEVLDLLEDRLRDYRAGVHRCAAADIPMVVADLLGDTSTIAPPGLDRTWAPGATVDDGSLDAVGLDGFDAVVTAASAAAAETGTIVLDSSPTTGRRALSLVPDHHVCVVFAAQVVHSVPELLQRLEPTRPLTFVSGPSATSDIELQRVEGVHGPRRLVVVLVGPATEESGSSPRGVS